MCQRIFNACLIFIRTFTTFAVFIAEMKGRKYSLFTPVVERYSGKVRKYSLMPYLDRCPEYHGTYKVSFIKSNNTTAVCHRSMTPTNKIMSSFTDI